MSGDKFRKQYGRLLENMKQDQDKRGNGQPSSRPDIRECHNPKRPNCNQLFDFNVTRECPKCGWPAPANPKSENRGSVT